MSADEGYRELLIESAENVFREACTPEAVMAADGGWSSALWATLTELGFTAVGVAEDAGGSGGSFADAVALVGVAARHAAPVPLAETLLSAHVADAAGLRVPSGPLTVVLPRADGDGAADAGTLSRVPWGDQADHLVRVSGRTVELIALATAERTPRPANIAGEPRADIVLAPGSVVQSGLLPSPWDAEEVESLGALFRVVQIAGALGRIQELTLEYIGQREQFGRRISAFQAVQQQVAVLAGIATAVAVAAEAAANRPAGSQRRLAVSAAKTYAGDACGRATAIAHQLHGAIGFAHEHTLHLYTRRVWAWREEYSSDAVWARRLGDLAFERGADELWELVAG